MEGEYGIALDRFISFSCAGSCLKLSWSFMFQAQLSLGSFTWGWVTRNTTHALPHLPYRLKFAISIPKTVIGTSIHFVFRILRFAFACPHHIPKCIKKISAPENANTQTLTIPSYKISAPIPILVRSKCVVRSTYLGQPRPRYGRSPPPPKKKKNGNMNKSANWFHFHNLET